jgi:hypothetical protein
VRIPDSFFLTEPGDVHHVLSVAFPNHSPFQEVPDKIPGIPHLRGPSGHGADSTMISPVMPAQSWSAQVKG